MMIAMDGFTIVEFTMFNYYVKKVRMHANVDSFLFCSLYSFSSKIVSS